MERSETLSQDPASAETFVDSPDPDIVGGLELSDARPINKIDASTINITIAGH